MFPFSSNSTYDLAKTSLLGVGSKSGRINPSKSMFPWFVIGLVLLHLLATSKTYCSFNLIINDRVISGIRTLVLLTRKVLYLITTPTLSLVKISLKIKESFLCSFNWLEVTYHILIPVWSRIAAKIIALIIQLLKHILSIKILWLFLIFKCSWKGARYPKKLRAGPMQLSKT